MTGTAAELQPVAMAAVGAAAVHDPRVAQMSSQRLLIAGIVQALKASSFRVDSDEAVRAVDEHYAHSDDQVTGDAIVAVIRRSRQSRALGEEQAAERRGGYDRLAELRAERDIIREWPCPTCGAGQGELCINALSGLPYGPMVPGHPARESLARTRPEGSLA